MLNDAFLTLKSNLEPTETFASIISQKHNAVRDALEKAGRRLDTQLIGSLQRQTRVRPRPGDIFDIDILVVLGEFTAWLPIGQVGGTTSQAAMNDVHGLVQLSARYGAMLPQQDKPTVTFSYADNVKVELVPAYRNMVGYSPTGVPHGPIGRGYWIPNSSGGWNFADYDYDAAYVSVVNQESGGTFIPLVKMLKAIKREHFPAMKSFHLEVIAAHLVPQILAELKQHGVAPTYATLAAHVLHRIENYINNPINLPGSNSPAVGVDLLTVAQIRQALEPLKEISRQALLTASDAEKQRMWRAIFGDVMPLP